MLSLIVGGAASGKSAFAQSLVLQLSGPRVYIATMEPWDAECRMRIARHRAQRSAFGFQTLECPRNLARLRTDAHANVLLDCLGNLLANELYASEAQDDLAHGDYAQRAPRVVQGIVDGVRHLRSCCDHLTIVTNEVCMAGISYEGDTLPYLRSLAYVNRTIAAEADFVCEVVAGLPNVLKDHGQSEVPSLSKAMSPNVGEYPPSAASGVQP